MRPTSLNGSNNEPQQQQELVYKQENSNDKKDNEIVVSQSPQHTNTAQKNFVVNLNQPPKIIQISNQVPMNLMAHQQQQQQQQQQQKNSPILLYQMQHNQANKICNQQPQQHMPQFKLMDEQCGKPENNSSQNIMLNTSNQIEQNSGMLLENCEFINSTKANLARSTSQKYLNQNLNFDENNKPDQQTSELKNDSNIRVYLSQQLQQKPMQMINQQDTGKPNEFHIIQQHQQPQQQYADNNLNQQHQQAPIQLQLFAQPGQLFDNNNFYSENNSQNSQMSSSSPAVSYMPIQIVSIDQPATHSSQNTNTNNSNNNNNNNNTSSSVSKADEVLDHIDIIINEVAAGSGTIPYSSDFDDEESKISLLLQVTWQIF